MKMKFEVTIETFPVQMTQKEIHKEKVSWRSVIEEVLNYELNKNECKKVKVKRI